MMYGHQSSGLSSGGANSRQIPIKLESIIRQIFRSIFMPIIISVQFPISKRDGFPQHTGGPVDRSPKQAVGTFKIARPVGRGL